MKLREWLPKEFFASYQDSKANKYLDIEIKEEYTSSESHQLFINGKTYTHKSWRGIGGTHKHVLYWVLLENGYAVGWNENPSRGWSFPVMKI